MRYLDIKNDGLHGVNSDAILSNLGYCMASTTDEDFYNNIYKIGFDLSKIVLNNYTNEEFMELKHEKNSINEKNFYFYLFSLFLHLLEI
jgi:hypothetical protein